MISERMKRTIFANLNQAAKKAEEKMKEMNEKKKKQITPPKTFELTFNKTTNCFEYRP